MTQVTAVVILGGDEGERAARLELRSGRMSCRDRDGGNEFIAGTTEAPRGYWGFESERAARQFAKRKGITIVEEP